MSKMIERFLEKFLGENRRNSSNVNPNCHPYGGHVDRFLKEKEIRKV